jgi:MscS family membrane protein
MRSPARRFVPICILLLLLPAAHAQLLSSPAAPPAAASTSTDPYGRDTPRGTMLGFIRAAQSGKYQAAAMYLEMPDAEREANGRRLASELRVILNRAFTGVIDSISNRPEGTLDDGLPPDEERGGVIDVEGQNIGLRLKRVHLRPAAPVWLISAETVAQIPEIYRQVGFPALESRLPEYLVNTHVLAMPLWQWIAAVILFPIACVTAWLIMLLAALPVRLVRRRNGHKPARGYWRVASAPVLVILAMVIHLLWIRLMGAPLLYRYYYNQVISVALVLGVGWLLWRWADRAVEQAQSRIATTGMAAATSMIVFGRRILKTLLVILLAITALTMMGVETKTALAGLGIGGIAVALAAQKTLENLIGGFTILSDRVFHIGDACKLGDRAGTIEDVSLRSTKVRTMEGTLLSIPNGVLATMSVENYSLRNKFLFNPTIGLRYETTSDQLNAVLAGTRRLLREYPKVETDGARASLVQFAESALNVEVFAYIKTTDYAEYCAIREELLLRIRAIVETQGSGLAFPSQTLYMAKDNISTARAS